MYLKVNIYLAGVNAFFTLRAQSVTLRTLEQNSVR